MWSNITLPTSLKEGVFNCINDVYEIFRMCRSLFIASVPPPTNSECLRNQSPPPAGDRADEPVGLASCLGEHGFADNLLIN